MRKGFPKTLQECSLSSVEEKVTLQFSLKSLDTAVSSSEKLKLENLGFNQLDFQQNYSIEVLVHEIQNPFYHWSSADNIALTLTGYLKPDKHKVDDGSDFGPGIYLSTNGYDGHAYGLNLYEIRLKHPVKILDIEQVSSQLKIDFFRKKRSYLEHVIRASLFKNEIYVIYDSRAHATWCRLLCPVEKGDNLFETKSVEVFVQNSLHPNMLGQVFNTRGVSPLFLFPDRECLKKKKFPPELGNVPIILQDLSPDREIHVELTKKIRKDLDRNAFYLWSSHHKVSLLSREYFFKACDSAFLKKLMWSFEFIDFYDLVLNFADNGEAPWRLYDSHKPEDHHEREDGNLMRWQKAMELPSSGNHLDLIENILCILSGQPRQSQSENYYRMKNVISGGPIKSDGQLYEDSIHDEYYCRATQYQINAIERHPFLRISDKKECNTGIEDANYLVRFYYFHVENFYELLSKFLDAQALQECIDKDITIEKFLIITERFKNTKNKLRECLGSVLPSDHEFIESLLKFTREWQKDVVEKFSKESLERLNYHIIELQDNIIPIFENFIRTVLPSLKKDLVDLKINILNWSARLLHKPESNLLNTIVHDMLWKKGISELKEETVDKYIRWAELKLEGMLLNRKALRFFVGKIFGLGLDGIEKYQLLMSIHPFWDFDGRSLRAYYRITEGFPLFMRYWNFDLLLDLDQFRKEAQTSRVMWFNMMAALKREYAAFPSDDRCYYTVPEIWLSLLDCSLEIWNELNKTNPDLCFEVEFFRDVKNKRQQREKNEKIIKMISESVKKKEVSQWGKAKCHYEFIHLLKKELQIFFPKLNIPVPVTVIFVFYLDKWTHADKHSIFLAGSFNDWMIDDEKWRMKKSDEKNVWTISAKFAPGFHEFKVISREGSNQHQWIPDGDFQSNILIEVPFLPTSDVDNKKSLVVFLYYNSSVLPSQTIHVLGEFHQNDDCKWDGHNDNRMELNGGNESHLYSFSNIINETFEFSYKYTIITIDQHNPMRAKWIPEEFGKEIKVDIAGKSKQSGDLQINGYGLFGRPNNPVFVENIEELVKQALPQFMAKLAKTENWDEISAISLAMQNKEYDEVWKKITTTAHQLKK